MRKHDAEELVLADRLVNYSDAIAALAFIISSGLGLAAADPDTRISFTDVTTGMIIGNIIMGLLFSALLVVLRRWELELRDVDILHQKVRKYSRYIYIARHVVVWLTVGQTAGIMLVID